jgi:hypothetical protein
MTEAERIRIAERARKAKEFLDSEVMKEALDGLEKANIDALLALAHDKDAERRDKVNQVNAIRALRAQLHAFMVHSEVLHRAEHKIA